MSSPTPRSFRISVTELAEFCCRSGDLNLGLERTPTAQDGQRGQRIVQSQRPPAYQREISVSTNFDGRIDNSAFHCILTGRIDGLLISGSLENSLLEQKPAFFEQEAPETSALLQPASTTLIEEIKTTYCRQPDLPPAQKNVHWAQLQLYGALYLQQHADAQLDLQLTYFNLDDESTYHFREIQSRAALEQFYADCIQRFSRWLTLQCAHLNKRDAFLQQLPFPFTDFRPGQRSLSVQAYRDLRDGSTALYQAATGLGKTVAVLYPALKLLGEGRLRQVFYLTAKTSGQRSLMQALQQIDRQRQHASVNDTSADKAQGNVSENTAPPLRVLFLGARERLCFCGNLNMGLCDWQTGYYDRLANALEAFQQETFFAADDLLQLARRFHLCPHQLSRHLLPWVDLVIADFNYGFDPQVRLLDHFDAYGKQIALLVDEAHNLPDRARDMFSTSLHKTQLQSAAKQIRHRPLKRRFKNILQLFPDSGSPAQAEPQLPEALTNAITLLAEAWLDWHAQQTWLVFPDELFEALMACVRFARRAQQWQDEDRLIQSGDAGGFLEIFCTDPAPRLRALARDFHACVFFSGSLLPLDYFARALSDEPVSSQLNLPSPFPPQHQCTLIVPINTRFDARAHSIAPIVELIATVWNTHPGRYLVSFPSYPYLQDVRQALQHLHPDWPVHAQTAGAQQADTFLQQLAQPEFLALVIAGGSFAEGLDLQDNKLHGVIVVGTCLPPPSLQRELIRQQADSRHQDGFDFAYRFPGLNRVIQSAGRVIRSETDRGIVILADDRFTRADTRRLLPAHWQPRIVKHSSDLIKPLQDFWSAPV